MPILAFWAAETPTRIAAATLALSVFVGSALLTLEPAAAQENTAEPERKTCVNACLSADKAAPPLKNRAAPQTTTRGRRASKAPVTFASRLSTEG